MRLKLSDLQRVVDETLQEKKYSDAFCNEIKKVFGPSVIVRDDLTSLVEAANEHLDVLEYRGRLNTINFDSNVASSMINHESADVRKLAARLLPENAIGSLVFDNNENVRYAAAKKAPLESIKEAIKKFPNDSLLSEALEARNLTESKPALEAAATHDDEDMLSETWYEGVARKLIQDYGRTLDTTWKTSAVKSYCSAVRATTRLPVDPVKLMDKMNELINNFDEARAKELGLKESYDRVLVEMDAEENEDIVDSLLGENLSPQQFIDKCNEVFGVKYATLPPAIMKYKVNEGLSLNKIPVSCTLPHGSAPRRIDEIALDSYTKHWNDKQKMMGEPFELKWDIHPEAINKITFKMELK